MPLRLAVGWPLAIQLPPVADHQVPAAGKKREQIIHVCEQTRIMASTLSDSVSSGVRPLSVNLGSKPRCLRAEAVTFAIGYR